jgi:hypothetical protein
MTAKTSRVLRARHVPLANDDFGKSVERPKTRRMALATADDFAIRMLDLKGTIPKDFDFGI